MFEKISKVAWPQRPCERCLCLQDPGTTHIPPQANSLETHYLWNQIYTQDSHSKEHTWYSNNHYGLVAYISVWKWLSNKLMKVYLKSSDRETKPQLLCLFLCTHTTRTLREYSPLQQTLWWRSQVSLPLRVYRWANEEFLTDTTSLSASLLECPSPWKLRRTWNKNSIFTS